MRIFFDSSGEVNYDSVDNDTTVSDMLEAVDVFLAENPLPCTRCGDSCCRNPWSVGVDNVSANSLCRRSGTNLAEYVDENLIKKLNYQHEFTQYTFKKSKECIYVDTENRCTVYEDRPVICRLYLCCKMSPRYNLLREMIACTCLDALVLEYEMACKGPDPNTISNYHRNPAVGAKNYDIQLSGIISYSEEEGWLYEDERQEL